MTLVKEIGIAAAQCADTQRQPGYIRFGEDMCEDSSADAAPLECGTDIEMVEQQAFSFGTDDDKAHTLLMQQDVPRMRRREGATQTRARANRIEAADTFEAFAHGLDAQCGERLEILFGGRRKQHR